MPEHFQISNYMLGVNIPIKISRMRGETIDQVKKRAVYAIVGKVSHPIIENGIFSGNCYVEDKYKASDSHNFYQNLQLDDPNILILRVEGERAEPSNINILKYILNILHKYSNYPYSDRYCVRTLSAIMTSEYNAERFNTKHLNVSHWNHTPVKILSNHLQLKDPNELAKALLSEEGLNERNRAIDIRKREEEWYKEIEEMRREEARDAANEEAWQECLRDELNYIMQNGGDWIDDC